jgi:hypothetical protein
MVNSEMMQWVCCWSLHISNIDRGHDTETRSLMAFDKGRVMDAVIIPGTEVAEP